MEYSYGEEFIQEKEQKERTWYENNGEQEKEYIELIEQKLAEGTQEARKSLLQLFRDKKFMEIYQSRNDIAYMMVIMKIYEAEVCNQEPRTILDMETSMDELRKKYIELKFILWRLEFEKDKDAKEKLIDYIHTNHATPDMIKQMIFNSVFNKGEVLVKLADIFLEYSMLRYAFSMLDYLNELLPGDEEILCMLAELCGCTGKFAKVKEYLEQIKEPGEMTERIRKKYGC